MCDVTDVENYYVVIKIDFIFLVLLANFKIMVNHYFLMTHVLKRTSHFSPNIDQNQKTLKTMMS